jgi:hypothetical protein
VVKTHQEGTEQVTRCQQKEQKNVFEKPLLHFENCGAKVGKGMPPIDLQIASVACDILLNFHLEHKKSGTGKSSAAFVF